MLDYSLGINSIFIWHRAAYRFSVKATKLTNLRVVTYRHMIKGKTHSIRKTKGFTWKQMPAADVGKDGMLGFH